MNTSLASNITDEIMNTQLDLIELYYLQLSSTWLVDSLFLFLNLPIAIISLFLNMFSYLIFDRFSTTNFNNKRTYYEYLKVYTLFSLFISLHNSINSFASAPRYFDMNSYFISFYKCKIAVWVFTLLYYYLNVIDCILLMERLSNLVDDYRVSIYLKKFFKLNPKLISFIIFLVCVLINCVSYFFVSPRSDDEYKEVMKDYSKIIKFTYCNREAYFSQSPGIFIVYCVILLRDGVPLLFEIGFGLYSIIMFKKYLKNRLRGLTSQNASTSDSRATNRYQTFNKIETYNDRLTRMTIYLCICSILSHAGVALGSIQVSNNQTNRGTILSRISIFLSVFLTTLKYFSNFFLYFYFNIKFQDYIKCKNVNS
jgi:hypothetical protein